MPVIKKGSGAGGTTEEEEPQPNNPSEKKNRDRDLRADPTNPNPTIRTDYGVQEAAEYYSNLRTVEQHSASTLPTDVTLYLSGLTPDQKQLARTAQVFATKFDVSPKYIFGSTNPNKYVNPVTGERLSLKDAQRFTNNFAPVAVTSMIRGAIEARKADIVSGTRLHPGSVRGGREVHANINPAKVAEWAKALSKYGGDIPLESGVAMAVYLASQKNLSRPKFENNVNMVLNWWSQRRTTSEGIDDQQVLAIAVDATKNGKVFRSIDEVTDSVFGEGTAINEQFGKWLRSREGAKYQLAATTRAMTTDDLVTHGPDYWNDIQAIETNVRLEQEAFQNSAFGKFLGGVGFVGSKMWQASERALVEIGFGIEIPVASALGTPLGKGGQTLHYLQNLRSEEITRLNQGEDVGDWVEEGYSNLTERYAGFRLPSWTSTAFDFGVGWYADPLVFGGKVSRVLRGEEAITTFGKGYSLAGRVLPRLEEPTVLKSLLFSIPKVGDRLAADEKLVTGILENGFERYVANIGESKLGDNLFRSLYKGNTAYLRELDLSTPGRNVTRSLDYEYMKLLRSKILERYPAASAEARQAFNEALTAHFATTAPPGGSIAEWVVNARTDRARGQVQDALAKGVIPDEGELAKAMSDYLAEGGQNAVRIPFSPEAPNKNGFFGPRRAVRRAITAPGVTDTAIGKRIAQIPNVNPGRVLNMHEADEYFVLHARRWGTFGERDVRTFQSQVLEAQSRGYWSLPNDAGQVVKYGYEDGVDRLMDIVNERAIDHILRNENVLPDAVAGLKKELLDPVRRENDKMRAFWVNPAYDEAAEKVLKSPLWETQRTNFRYVVDPVQIRRDVREFTGLNRRMETHFYKALGKEAPEIAGRLERGALDRFLSQSVPGSIESAYRAYRRTWKALTVARPGYIPRVILTDENARFMFTTRSISERLLSQEWFGLVRKLDEKGIGQLTFQLGDETKHIPLPGAYEGNALAGGTLRQAEQAEEIVRSAKSSFDKHAFSGGWGPVTPATNEAAHLASWRWGLEKQLRGSAPGRIALDSIAAGDDVAATRAKLLQWANDDHFVVLNKRIGVAPADYDTWFDDAAHGAHAYTASDPVIADAAKTLEGKDLEKVLSSRIPVANRPTVHGPGMEATYQGGGHTWGNNFTNALYEYTVRRPELALNRNPYYKAMKRRAETAYYSFLEKHVPDLDLTLDGVPTFRVPGRGPEDIVKPVLDRPAEELAPRLAKGDAEGYMYHISPPEYMESIQRTGLEPRQLGLGKNMAASMKEERLFFADSLDDAKRLAHGPGEKVAFRVKASKVGMVQPEELFPGSQYIRRGIPTDQIEVLTARGDWKPLAEAGRLVPGNIHHAIDIASTNFALQRVRSVMFDLTRQSRFTELLQLVFPFPQPFFEGFQTWGAIAMRHPEAVGRVGQLFRTGVESGFIKKDEQSGEYVIPMGAFRWLAGATWALKHGEFDDVGGGSDNRLDKLGIGFVAPLSSFNMLASTTIKASGSTPIIGKLVGGVPIPAPGMDPGAALLLQGLYKDSKSVPVASYLFQFGPSSPLSLVPTPVKSVLSQLMPDAIPESQREALAFSLLRSYQVNGMDKDANGNPVSLEDLQKMAEQDADELLQVRNLVQLLSPASLRLKTPASPFEAEWQDLVESSPDYFTAIDEWTKRHPDLSYITVGKTFYDAGIKGPNDSYIQAPRIPASQFVDHLLKTPGVGQWMQNNRAWAGLALIGIDPAIAEAEDFSVYSKMLSEGLVKYRPLDKYLEEGEDRKVSGVVDDWYRNVWEPAASNITDFTSPQYRDMVAQRDEFLAGLAHRYPNWAQTHLLVKGEGDQATYSWPDGLDKPAWYALAQARQIADTPGFENAPGFQALQKYLDIRDGIEKQMRKDGIIDITLDPDLQERLGKRVAKLEQETPGIKPFISAYFGTNVDDSGALISSDWTLQTLPQPYIKRIEGLPDEIRDGVIKTMSHYQQMRSNADRTYDYAWQKNQNYQDAQAFFDRKFIQQPEVVRAWWNKYMTEKEKAYYMDGLATKPPVFYSAWDWHLQGVKLNDGSVNKLEQIAQWRVDITRYSQENPKAEDIGDHYAKLDNQVREWAQKDKRFADVINKTNSWSFSLRAAGYGSQSHNKKVDAYWGYILDLADKVQDNVDVANRSGGDFHGTGGFDKDAKAGWRAQQDWLLQWVKYYQDDSPAFKRSWYDVQEANGDPLVGDILVPDTYYRLGG